ncbi:FHA domain-containing protein [Bifidobacterium sp. CP2]|nr:FHA domain-containing protein [Bifidobacterium sp. CP2]MBW3081418.1 FHA domain-containing protein [Bifidobacterium saguinibicoloris]
MAASGDAPVHATPVADDSHAPVQDAPSTEARPGLASTGLTGTGPIVTGTFVSGQTAASEQAAAPHTPEHAPVDDHDEDWDSTVLSSSFTIKQTRKTYLLHNDVTGQSILIDRSVLLGRKPSEEIPEGAKAVKIEDPTRTTSRNHAAISIDQNGQLWIEDYGSLNGTFIIKDGEEHQVVKGTPAELDAPATLRIGDQFFTLQEQ